MDFEASSLLGSRPVRSSPRQMQFDISRPTPSTPIRSSPLEPNAHVRFKATVLEANPLEPARANCISDLKHDKAGPTGLDMNPGWAGGLDRQKSWLAGLTGLAGQESWLAGPTGLEGQGGLEILGCGVL
jgi:hypothetical protein